ncbi:hypothetical protein DPMN_076393 [Dreissena polymorpha]|uniref:Uncharacterized protein n=1 Tax=Dreissena polymorpha TaxID=45954 RepID=A0A9D3YIM0_DREPO|nr:hypothetical protein DPMN_076393 [Dreissena polymorpha]
MSEDLARDSHRPTQLNLHQWQTFTHKHFKGAGAYRIEVSTTRSKIMVSTTNTTSSDTTIKIIRMARCRKKL